DHAVVIEVKAGYGVARFRLLRLFFDAERAAAVVELDDAVALGIFHRVGEYRCALLAGARAVDERHEFVAEEDVVAQNEGGAPVADEIAPDEEGLRDAGGLFLHRIGDIEPPLPPIAE